MDGEPQVRILLVVADKRREALYVSAFQQSGAVCCVLNNWAEAVRHAAKEPHSGIAADVKLMIRIPQSLQGAVADLQNGLPGATLNMNPAGGEKGDVRILPRGMLAETGNTLARFAEICAGFAPRLIFDRKREPINHNVLLSHDQAFSEPSRTVCIDISEGGCFLFSVDESIKPGDTVWLRLPDAVSAVPVRAAVCWLRKWDTDSQGIPGIGIRFETERIPG